MEQSSYFYDNWLGKTDPLDYVTDKERSIKAYMRYMLIRLQKMFKYKNLPDTIPSEMLEYYLLCNGSCIIAKDDASQLFALTGNPGGVLDAYYRPTKYIVANPALNLTKEYVIGEDAVLMRNDTMWQGLYPLMSRYASLLAENVITIRSADIMLRVMAMLTAPDDKTKIAAEAYLRQLEDGKFGVISENRFLDGVKMQSPPSNNGSYLTQFIELQQYLKGSFYNEIGLNANFNMKREAIGEGESSLNEDSLLPLCENMLSCRQEDVKKVNEMFGLNIEVEFDSAWANNSLDIELRLQALEVQASQLATAKEGQVTEDEVVDEESVTEDEVVTDEESVTEDVDEVAQEESVTEDEAVAEEDERGDEDEDSAVEDEDTND